MSATLRPGLNGMSITMPDGTTISPGPHVEVSVEGGFFAGPGEYHPAGSYTVTIRPRADDSPRVGPEPFVPHYRA